ncbi:mCG1046440, partial [Mus musculus]
SMSVWLGFNYIIHPSILSFDCVSTMCTVLVEMLGLNYLCENVILGGREYA